MVKFFHPNDDIGTLNLRLPPTSVSWTYNLVTNTQNTYAGQVIQILAVNIDTLTITGRFGKEGPHGRNRSGSELRDYKTGDQFGVGLTQMTEYFHAYFSVASQGNDSLYTGNYDQRAIELTYDGALDVPIDVGGKPEKWLVHPISFPSYRRSNQDFAPEWQVECQVVEPSIDVKVAAEQDAITRLRTAVGYRPNNEFSDPMGQFLPHDMVKLSKKKQEALLKEAQAKVSGELDDTFSHFQGMLPAYTDQDLESLLLMGGSLPTIRRNKNG